MFLRRLFFLNYALYTLIGIKLLVPIKLFAGETNGSVGVETVDYLNLTSTDKSSLFPSLNLNFETSASGSTFEGKIQVNSKFSLDNNYYNYIEAPEIYAGTSSALLPTTKISLGRKIVHWSLLDERWGLGLWQPRFRWDYLSPEQVGLTGVFFTVDLPAFQLAFFGTPGFIPERGVPFDASLHSQSPWWVSPPSEMNIFHEATPTQYHLNIPPVKNILLNGGGSIMARLGDKEGLWISGAYAYLPLNQLLLAYDGYLDLQKSVVAVELYPRVMYHHLISLQGGFTGEPFSAYVSLLREIPVTPRDQVIPDSWTIQQISPATAISSSIDMTISGSGASASHIFLDYLKRWGGDAPDSGPLSSGNQSNFESRYPFQQAIRLGEQGPLSSHINAKSSVLYDIFSNGTILSTELSYHPSMAWMIKAGIDFLAAGQDSGFINQYQANDRFYSGVTYVY